MILKRLLLIISILAILVVVIFICLYKIQSNVPERVILITLDTLRPDHLGCYGYIRPMSPFIDILASGGCVFKQTYAPMPSTVPSHASIFTSYYPGQLNVLRNGYRLADEYLTMAEIFKRSGITIAAIASVVHLFNQANLDQGFDYYQQPKLSRDVLYRPADQMVDTAIAWLKDISPDKRFFLWLHLYDPHGPYQPPPSYLNLFSDQTEAERGNFVKYLREERHLDPDFCARLPFGVIRDTIDLTQYRGKKSRSDRNNA